MTDEELIRRMRDACRGGETCKCSLNEAADRIEALLQERQAHHANPADFRYWEGRYRDEKANLAKAVGALQKIAYGGAYTDMQIARAVLAEIGGGA